MAAANSASGTEEYRTLPDCYKLISEVHEELETTEDSTASDKLQARILEATKAAELAITMVNELSLFSQNEDIDEVSTNEIRYMLLSAYLGYFTMLNTHLPRQQALNKSIMCYKDFLRLCKLYSVVDYNIDVTVDEEEDTEAPKEKSSEFRVQDMNVMAAQRNNKIQRFKEKKAMESKIAELKVQVEKEHVDDEVKREFYVTQLKHWANRAVDEIDNSKLELQMLQHREELKKSGGKPAQNDVKEKKPKPFRPFILTKTELQKKVYGAGYPALPTMTVDEFYDQKVKEGTLSDSVQGHSMQSWAQDPEKDALEREKEDTEKENKIDRDDPETLARMRAMDDWKDEHRRGDGNRHNKG